tara:strand:- start:153 stop:374 length:222 start_codon:yes stop_codon:yes gene_type:complete
MKTPVGQKFELNQVVKRNATIGYSANKYAQFTGKITEAFTRKNKLGVSQYYYKVFWEDGRSSEHAQHSLKSFP